jgi:hypothetical protein
MFDSDCFDIRVMGGRGIPAQACLDMLMADLHA